MLDLHLVILKVGAINIIIFPNIFKTIKRIRFVFDIGAHVGIVTLAVAKNIKKNGVIYAFEPSKVNLKFLKYHIACNKIKNVKNCR